MVSGARFVTEMNISSLYRGVNLHLAHSIFDHIYDRASLISYYNTISRIIMPDVLKNPMLYDVLNVLSINRT